MPAVGPGHQTIGLLTEGVNPFNESKEGNMKAYTILGIVACSLLSVPSLSWSQDQPVTGEKAVTFQPTYKCSTHSPCQNITGEILRIEEDYWVRDPEGGEIHLRVTKETKMDQEPTVGERIAAQLRSNGEANTIVKLSELPKAKELADPLHSQKDFRDSQATQPAGNGEAMQPIQR